MIPEWIIDLFIIAVFGGIFVAILYVFITKFADKLCSNPSITQTPSFLVKKCTPSSEELIRIVANTSEWYKQVQELSDHTIWHTDILDNGHSKCYLYVNSKAQFDRATPWKTIDEFLVENRERIMRDRELVRDNWDINDAYQKSLNALSSSITPEKCRILGIDYKIYSSIEQQLVENAKLDIINSYCVTCKIIYISPGGRKLHEKEIHFNDFDIDVEYDIIDCKNSDKKVQASWQRSERSKLTPSLRYDILRRDRFRCCLCGRSAQDGIELEVDHIIPVSKGGETTYDNLQTLCRDCNRGKGAKL